MAVRLLGPNLLLIEQPFDGEGVSLYVNLGPEVKYRRPVFLGGRRQVLHIPGESRFVTGNPHGIPLPRTLRATYAPAPAVEMPHLFPVEWNGEEIALNLRTYKDGIENEDISVARVTLNGDGEIDATLAGTATLLAIEIRDGGVVVIRFDWVNTGSLEPETFTLIRTAGPTTPTNVIYSAVGDGVYEIETEELDDSAPYTFKIQAAAGVVTADVLTGITVTADATGPDAPSGSAVAW